MKKRNMEKKFIVSFLIMTFLSYNYSLAAIAATEINVGGPLPTATTVSQNNNNFNIQTTTAVKNGTIGINSFDKFNVAQGDIVNLNLINNQTKLVNLIFDNSASQINGTINSYLNSQIGGNILFANPNGFVVGSTGKFNVGSLTLMTPTEDSMRSLINSDYNFYDEGNIEKLIGFLFLNF